MGSEHDVISSNKATDEQSFKWNKHITIEFEYKEEETVNNICAEYTLPFKSFSY